MQKRTIQMICTCLLLCILTAVSCTHVGAETSSWGAMSSYVRTNAGAKLQSQPIYSLPETDEKNTKDTPELTPEENYARELRRQQFRGVAGSPEWLKQAYVQYMTLDCSLKLYDKTLIFRETLVDDDADDMPVGAIKLRMRARDTYGQVVLHVSPRALSTLQESGVTSVEVINYGITDCYRVSDMIAVLDAAGLSDVAELQLAGDEGEVFTLTTAGEKVQILL